jgi:hypothetical protein
MEMGGALWEGVFVRSFQLNEFCLLRGGDRILLAQCQVLLPARRHI